MRVRDSRQRGVGEGALPRAYRHGAVGGSGRCGGNDPVDHIAIDAGHFADMPQIDRLAIVAWQRHFFAEQHVRRFEIEVHRTTA